MPLTRAEKEAVVASYQEGLAQAAHAILVSYSGISVPQVTELRDKIRASGGSYVVVKNRLALRAIEGAALEGLKEHFRGTLAIAYTDGDPVALAKVLADFSSGVPALEFRAGLVEGQAVGAHQIQQIAELPGRDELVAKLLFLLQSPIARLVRTLGAIPRQLVTVLDQIAKTKSEG
jgi:large subunit ribosomal protein L10